MFEFIAKTYFAEKNNIDPEDIVVVCSTCVLKNMNLQDLNWDKIMESVIFRLSYHY